MIRMTRCDESAPQIAAQHNRHQVVVAKLAKDARDLIDGYADVEPWWISALFKAPDLMPRLIMDAENIPPRNKRLHSGSIRAQGSILPFVSLSQFFALSEDLVAARTNHGRLECRACALLQEECVTPSCQEIAFQSQRYSRRLSVWPISSSGKRATVLAPRKAPLVNRKSCSAWLIDFL